MNHLFLILSIFLPIIAHSIDPNQCDQYFNDQSTQTQYMCGNQTNCYIHDGLSSYSQGLPNKAFKLCLNLTNYNLIIDNNQSITPVVFSSSLYISAPSVTMNSFILQAAQYIVIQTQSSLEFVNITIRGTSLWFSSQQITIINGSNFINESTLSTSCTCTTQTKIDPFSCKWNYSYPQLYSPNFTISLVYQSQNFIYSNQSNNSITIIAKDFITMENITIYYSVIGIFTTNINIYNSSILSSGLGYASGSGPGCGYYDLNLNNFIGCAGSGGSYGGFGGNSSPLDNCKLMASQSAYGNFSYPNDPGSGGGFILPSSLQSSSGGGIINIQVINFNFTSNSVISAEGKQGKQGGGGGSGGSISIDYSLLNIDNSKISVNGGTGDKKLSSSGAGGRIRFWDHNNNNYNQQTTDHVNNFVITSNGGSNCQGGLSCGQLGSIFASPCLNGKYRNETTFLCTDCPLGTYQLSYGYQYCLPCPSLSSISANYSGKTFWCNYTCSNGNSNISPQTDNGFCYTSTQKFFKTNISSNFIISAGLILLAFIIFGLVKCIEFMFNQQSQLSSKNYQSGISERKRTFKVQDLPYHQFRLYLMGENTPKKPWKITAQTQNNFDQELALQYTMTKIRNKIKGLMTNINIKARFAKQQKMILKFLYYYPPCHRLMLNYFQRKKVQSIQLLINDINQPKNNLQDICVKFHVKPNLTVASIQIFDYNKKQQEFDIDKCYPLYFELQKTPFGGHLLDLSDPFLRFLFTQITQKQGYVNEIQNFFKQLNIKLKKKQQTIAVLNHLHKLNQLSSRLQAYLWQPNDHILGVNRDFKIDKKMPLFFMISCQNLKSNHFFYEKRLSDITFTEVQGLKKIIEIKEQLANEDHGSNFWIWQNQISQKILLWILGLFTSILLILSLAAIVYIILITIKSSSICGQGNITILQIVVFYVINFTLAPLCNFVLCFFNLKVILQKNEFILFNAMILTMVLFIKSFIEFFLTLPIPLVSQTNQNTCSQISIFIQLSIAINCIFIYFAQILMRSSIINNAK